MRWGVPLRWLVCLVFVWLLAVAGLGAVSPAAGGPAQGSTLGTDDTVHSATVGADGNVRGLAESARPEAGQEIQLVQEYWLTPGQPGEYDAVHTYNVPADVTSFNLTVRDGAEVIQTRGFERYGPGTYEWDESTSQPSVTLRVAANQTIDGTGPIGTDGDYRFVDTGDWALVLRPSIDHVWTWPSNRPSVGFDRTATVDGEGAASETIAFLGPQETYTRSAHGQTISLIVPESATLNERPDAIFDSLFHASETLRVGDRDEEVFVVAAPTGTVDWGVRGVQTGDADVWVRDRESLADADSVWLHEYVHTRQDFQTADDARWLIEGGATYYAARLAHEQERISFDAFQDTLGRGTRARYADAVLSDRSTWEDDPNYAVGGLVAGELDRRTRLTTDSGASLDRIFARLNDHDGPVDGADFYAHLATVAGEDVATAGERFATTADRPVPWDATQHGEAFGVTPARFQVTFDGESPFDVSGAYRNRSLGDGRPLVVVLDERVNVSVAVENTGGAAGDYDVVLSVDGSAVHREGGRLGPGDRTTDVLGHEFTTTGTYTLAVADERVDVRVREPADPDVIDFRADSTRVEPGTTVTLSIDLENGADRPAAGSIHVTKDGDRIDERSVRLDVGETDTLTVETVLTNPGEYTFELGETSDRTVTVVVEDPFPTALVVAGGGVVLLVLLLGMGVTWWRKRCRRCPAREARL